MHDVLRRQKEEIEKLKNQDRNTEKVNMALYKGMVDNIFRIFCCERQGQNENMMCDLLSIIHASWRIQESAGLLNVALKFYTFDSKLMLIHNFFVTKSSSLKLSSSKPIFKFMSVLFR